MDKKRQKGSLTVEAAVVIVMFIFGYVAIANLSNFIRAQMIIQYSITQAAKDISAYCYIVSKTGLMEDSARLGEEAAAAKADADEVIDTVAKLYEAVESGSENIPNSINEIPFDGDWVATLDGIENAGNLTQEEFNNMVTAGNQMIDKVDEYFSSPEQILKGLVSVVKDEGFQAVKSYAIAAPISKALVKNQISAYGESSNGQDILAHLGVVDGVEGLNFLGCSLFNDGKTIVVSVTYSMKVELPFIETKEFQYKQTASTEAWGSKHGDRPWRG